jgi:NAD-dependent SIR2 family protein deacetylase
MKLDCPHCHKSLEGRFIRWSKIQRKDNMRSCPHCGGELEFQVHPVEVVTRVLAAVVAIAVCYSISRGEGIVKALVVGLAVLAAAYGVQLFMTREAQRYRKGRN